MTSDIGKCGIGDWPGTGINSTHSLDWPTWSSAAEPPQPEKIMNQTGSSSEKGGSTSPPIQNYLATPSRQKCFSGRLSIICHLPSSEFQNFALFSVSLVQTYGAEVGIRALAVDGLQSTFSLWWLDVDSELLFVGDAGATEASRPSRRYGVEWANFYNLTKNLTLDADISFSHAEFRDDDAAGNEIPGSTESVVSAGVTHHSDKGFFGSVRLRYFGPRPLKEDNTFRSDETILLNRKDHDIDYAYESQITPGGAINEEIHFHPVA